MRDDRFIDAAVREATLSDYRWSTYLPPKWVTGRVSMTRSRRTGITASWPAMVGFMYVNGKRRGLIVRVARHAVYLART